MKKIYRSFIIILSVLLFVMPFGTVKAETGSVDEKLFSECAEEYAYEFLNCSFGTTENKLSQTTEKYSVLPCYYDYARALSAYFRSRMELYAYEDVSISIRPTDKAIENNIYYFNYLVDIGFQLLLNDNRSGIGRKMTVAVREFDGKPQIIGLVLITEPFLDLDVSGHVTDEEVRSSLRTFIDEPSRSTDYIAELEKTTSKNNSTPRYTKEDIKNSTVTKEDNRKMEENHSKKFCASADIATSEDQRKHNGEKESSDDAQSLLRYLVTITSSQRFAIANYAKNNCYLTFPASGNSYYVSNYYDFSTIPESYDCTNFASHCLLAGGATPQYSSSSDYGWYYINLSNRSHSWSGVNPFYEFITTNTGTVGPKAVTPYFVYACPSQYIYYDIGDLIQIDYYSDGSFDHSTIVTGFILRYPNSVVPCVTSRSGVGTYNNDAPFDNTNYSNNSHAKRVASFASL